MSRTFETDRSAEEPRWRGALGLFLVAILVLSGAPLLAQQADEEAATTEEQGEEAVEKPVVGDVITVTARKREENVQEVPVAVTVVTGESLEDQAAADISAIEAQVPNLSIYPGRNQSTTLTAFMRGVGQADPLWGVDPGVGLYLDDVYIARPQGALLDVFDLERIEVLRGPQGTLYGKNTIGGAIKYVSRELTDTPRGSISFTGGDYSNQDVKFSISGPIVEGKVRGKVAIASLQHDGFGTNLFTGRDNSDKDTTAVRVGLDFLPSEDVTVKLRFDRTEDNAEPKGYARLAPNPFCPLFLITCQPLPGLFDTQSGLDPANGTTSEGYSLTVVWDINDDWQFKSISAHRESDTKNNIDFDTTPAVIADTRTDYFDDQDSREFQFIYTGGERLDGVLGFYYFDGFAGGNVPFSFVGGAVNGVTDGDTTTESLAVFGDGSYAINDKATFNFGLRLTEEDKTGRALNTLNTIPGGVAADFQGTTTFSSVSPKLGIDYQFNDDVMGYVTASRGFKSGGYNVRAQTTVFPESGLPFDDEVLTVLEVGVKSVLAGGSLILNTAAFTGDYTDVQVSTFTSYDSNGDGTDDSFFGDFLNAGDATLTGLELEWDWKPQTVTWLGLSGNLSFLGTDVGFLDADDNNLVDTQVITNAPKTTGALNLNFNRAALGGLISGSVGYAYRHDSVLTNEGNGVEPIVQPAFGLLNAWISWLSEDGKWRFTINGKNLSDRAYLTNGYNIPALGVLTGSYGYPMQVTGTIGYTLF